MKRAMTYLVVIALLAGGVAGGLWLRSRRLAASETGPEILRTAPVTRESISFTVASSGHVVVARQLNLSFGIPGTVRAVDVEVGDRVEKGQQLASLDSETLEEALQRVRLDLEQAELNLGQLQKPADADQIQLAELAAQESIQAMSAADLSKEVALARTQLNQTRAVDYADTVAEAYDATLDTLDRFGLPEAYAAGITASAMEAQGNVGITQLRGEQAIQQAQSSWLSAYERYQRAVRNVQLLKEGAPEDRVLSLELTLKQVEISLGQAISDLDSANLTSPTDGVVAAVNVEAGSQAVPGLPALTILDDSQLFVDLTVDEIDIGAVEEGQSVHLTLDAYPGEVLLGSVDRIDILPQTTGGIITYPVRVLLLDVGNADVREGMTAGATILVGGVSDVVAIPSWAVRTDQSSDQVYVYRVAEGSVQRVEVTIGARNETWTEVVSGLVEGDAVALVSEARSILDFQGPPSSGIQ